LEHEQFVLWSVLIVISPDSLRIALIDSLLLRHE
jgi:hypothetical protein